ncbi:MAG: manganese efflux pump [Deltaproteobacteria bacterium]|nr:manganese efflux pump [Deltaproteobacteria bacterium]
MALAMDAFAVSIITGLSLAKLTLWHCLRMAGSFGLFQAIMLMLGWLAGELIYDLMAKLDHWIAFTLLALVGGKMLKESFKQRETHQKVKNDPTKGWSLIALSLATSIDALAVGLSFEDHHSRPSVHRHLPKLKVVLEMTPVPDESPYTQTFY